MLLFSSLFPSYVSYSLYTTTKTIPAPRYFESTAHLKIWIKSQPPIGMGNICITKRRKIRILLTASTSLPFSQVMFFSLSHSKTLSFYNLFIITSSLRSVHNVRHNLLWLQVLLLSRNHHSCFNKTWNMLFCCTEFKTEINKSQNLSVHDSWLYRVTTHRNENITCS